MSFLRSIVQNKIGYKHFPTENYIISNSDLALVNEKIAVNTANRGCVEINAKGSYENLTTAERQDLIQKRFFQDKT